MPGLWPAVAVPWVHLKENVSLNIVSMKIDKLTIKMLAVVFALLPTAGLGESFAQTFKGGKAIHDYFLVKDLNSATLLQI